MRALVSRWRRMSGLSCALATLATSCAFAQAQRDDVGDALAGHRAEQRQWAAEKDVLRRPLFFNPVDIENQPGGVPCDHLADLRPDVVAGRGWVALLTTRAAPQHMIRFWIAPPNNDNAESVARAARKFAADALENAEFELVAVRSFAWCR